LSLSVSRCERWFHCLRQECTEKIRALAMKHLSRFINIREPNIRYLGLEAMARIAKLEGTADEIRKQQAAILVCVLCAVGVVGSCNVRIAVLCVLWASPR
jgi:hypothetical protein